ncbi:hypothetical protein C8R45DRAFT_1130857 [Mycena sanguinolenta]|nr:hypothetical protein C8R45DRAFT_1130857 [Mycena sanguinolenta]
MLQDDSEALDGLAQALDIFVSGGELLNHLGVQSRALQRTLLDNPACTSGVPGVVMTVRPNANRYLGKCRHIVRYLRSNYPDPEQYTRKLLPVVYATLDSGRLPDDTTPEPTFLHRVPCATYAMTFFSLKTLNAAAVRDLWSRVRARIRFIDIHDYFLTSRSVVTLS